MNSLFFLFLLQIAHQTDCPCHLYTNRDDCEAYFCFFDEKASSCREISCSERSLDECLNFNNLRRFQETPLLCSLKKKSQDQWACVTSPETCSEILGTKENCEKNRCDLSENLCKDYPVECLHPMCSFHGHLTATDRNLTGFCLPDSKGICNQYRIDAACNDINESIACQIYSNCQWENKTCQDLQCKDRKYGECSKHYFADIYHFCVEKEGSCQIVVVEELIQFQCKRNSVRQFTNNQCRSCNTQRWFQKDELIPTWNDGNNSAYYQEKEDLDDKFIELNGRSNNQKNLLNFIGRLAIVVHSILILIL